MEINQLSKIIKKKCFDDELIENLEIIDNSYLHKGHKGNLEGKFHIKLLISSNRLKKINRLEANKKIYKLLDNEIKLYIHSIQIEFI
tara:strand:- start:405 stop:665 length:261 start_codon:yes stop_codon:yes gene_type:complete